MKIQKHPRIFSFSINVLLSLTLLIGMAIIPTSAHADGTITVTTNTDNTTDDDFCSLREAITNANDDFISHNDCNAGTGNDTIVFANGITVIALGSTLPTITDPDGLTINGGSDVTLDGSDNYRILMVDSGVLLTLENLTVEDGACASCIGGGVYSSGGTLVILNSIFSSNQQGVYVYEGSITITNSTFTGNSSTYGGAVNSSGSNSNLTISNSVFSGNSTPSGGGSAIYSAGALSVTNSSFINNTGTGGSASSVFTDGGSEATITKSTFSGIVSATTRAIYNNGATLTIANSTFYGNTVSDYGGGVMNVSGTLTIKNSTFSDNSAPSGGGDIYQYGSSSVLNLSNVILANNSSGGNCVIDNGTVSGNNNMIEGSSSACGFTNGINGNIIGSDPKLGAPTGSPAYLPLNRGSLAIDSGDDSICLAAPVNNTSQNGITRPQGSHCERGSFEANAILTFKSAKSRDGWVLESTETSNVGGTLDSTATTFNLGDNAQDKQYRVILSFNTATLSDTAVITKVTLKIRKQGLVGTDPFTILGGLKVDMRKPYFGTAIGLAVHDFQAAAGKTAVATFNATPVSGWYSALLNVTGRAYINKTGTTQFRLYFRTDDNNDNGADYMKFFSGNYATVSARPTLIIEYYLP
ncbi:MAG: hypothetical protein C4583_11495 [Anaerolineaceae bacterium]|nr:MAG: hypothetical protein C4583_11495 [Anaerolineaceae bacterium]